MAKPKPIRKIRKIIADTTPFSVAVLMILSLAMFQILSMILSNWFDVPMIKIGASFFLLIVAASIILPYGLIMGAFKLDRKDVLMIIFVLGLDILFLVYIAPKVLPQVFSTIEVVL